MENKRTGMLPPKKMVQERHAGNISQIYNAIYNRHKNGFDKVVRRIGGRWLVDVSKYYEWLDTQSGITPEEAA